MKKNIHLSYAKTAAFLAACILFGGAYYQCPLFTGNQNTYFLSGLAHAGYGYLSADWLANQTDLVPAFSSIVSLVHIHGSHWMFYLLLFGLAAVYAGSLSAIAARRYVTAWSTQQMAVFIALLVLLHCAWLLTPLAKFIPGLWRIAPLFQKFAALATNGVASQHILGRYLQPSAFGVLLLTSLALFIYGKEHIAVLCAVVAATIHTSLILHAGILVVAYMTVLISEKRVWRAAKIGALALVLILPIVLYVGNRFFLSDTHAIHLVGQAIGAEVRQPHHAKISVWFSGWSCAQLAIVFVGLVLSRQCKRLFIILLVCTIAAVGLTLLQMISGSLPLALLFPWRTSTWLIPVCTAIVLGNVSVFACNIIGMIPAYRIRGYAGRCVVVLSISVLVGACLLGVYRTISEARADRDYGAVMSYARMHSGLEQTYLIPLNLGRFRLATGLPVFVDWKSFPYRSSEIIEWYDRVRLARAFFEAKNSTDAIVAWANIQNLARVTHVIVEGKTDHLRGIMQARFKFRDSKYVVYEMRNSEKVEQSNTLDGE
jgi:hypothetical protein